MTEDQLEREALGWLADVGYTHAFGPDIAPDGPTPERANYRQVLAEFHQLAERLYKRIRACSEQAQTLATLRDTLLPRLISGQLRLPAAQAAAEEALARTQ
jgi:type I restriction enzyme R subunit